MLLGSQDQTLTDITMMFGLLIAFVSIPLVIYRVLSKGDLESDEFKAKFSNLIDQVDTRKSSNKFYQPCTLLGRLVFIFTPIMVNSHAWLQV